MRNFPPIRVGPSLENYALVCKTKRERIGIRGGDAHDDTSALFQNPQFPNSHFLVGYSIPFCVLKTCANSLKSLVWAAGFDPMPPRLSANQAAPRSESILSSAPTRPSSAEVHLLQLSSRLAPCRRNRSSAAAATICATWKFGIEVRIRDGALQFHAAARHRFTAFAPDFPAAFTASRSGVTSVPPDPGYASCPG
jgi:hypothetical protein